MSCDESEFPLETIEELTLSNNEKSLANKEKVIPDMNFDCLTTRIVPSEVGERYKHPRRPCHIYLCESVALGTTVIKKNRGLRFIFHLTPRLLDINSLIT